MPKHELLNNITHKDVGIITQKSARYGDAVSGSLIFPEEFTAVQREYPIFFQKDTETGAYQAITLFGFRADENLFLSEQGWDAKYIPALMEREPFLIGFQAATDNTEPTPVIYIDMDNPRVTTHAEGQPVFLPHGGNTSYIDHIGKILMLIHEGVEMSKHMFNAFVALDLIESCSLEIEFNNGEVFQSSDYYTINQEKFFALSGDNLTGLHQAGYLHYAYMVIASLGNVKSLIERRNTMLGKQV